MTWLQHWCKKFFLVFTVGLGLFLWSSTRLYAEQAGLTERYPGIREKTVQYIALGTPDDLIRLQDVFYETERELARLQFGLPVEGLPKLAEKQKNLKGLQNRLAESEVVFQHLDRSGEEMPVRAGDGLSAEERASLRNELLSRINKLQKDIGSDKEAIRSEEAVYLRTLTDERKALANLLTLRRVELLAEYARFPDCQDTDRPCFQNELRMLCNLKPLVSEAERLPILRLIAGVKSRLNAWGHPETPICESVW